LCPWRSHFEQQGYSLERGASQRYQAATTVRSLWTGHAIELGGRARPLDLLLPLCRAEGAVCGQYARLFAEADDQRDRKYSGSNIPGLMRTPKCRQWAQTTPNWYLEDAATHHIWAGHIYVH